MFVLLGLLYVGRLNFCLSLELGFSFSLYAASAKLFAESSVFPGEPIFFFFLSICN